MIFKSRDHVYKMSIISKRCTPFNVFIGPPTQILTLNPVNDKEMPNLWVYM